MKLKYWYYSASIGYFAGFRVFPIDAHQVPDSWDEGYIFGPFRTFKEAKKDAFAYFSNEVETSLYGLALIKSGRPKA